MVKKRGEKGFIQIGEEKRQVRSLRATDSTWERLTTSATARGISPADLIEEFAQKLKRPPAQESAIPNEILRSSDMVGSPKDSSEATQKAIALLEQALFLKANAGGAIKTRIREALQLLSNL